MGQSAARTSACLANEKRRECLTCRGKDPIKGQNSQEPRFRYFSVPATARIIAGDFLFTKDPHRLVFREHRLRALSLQIDVMTAFRTSKNNSIGFTHACRITLGASGYQYSKAPMFHFGTFQPHEAFLSLLILVAYRIIAESPICANYRCGAYSL
jgi:hypothetical protein